MVRQRLARDAEKPRQRVAGQAVEPSPCDKERVRYDIVSDLRGRASERVGEYPPVVLAIDGLEPVVGIGTGVRLAEAGSRPEYVA